MGVGRQFGELWVHPSKGCVHFSTAFLPELETRGLAGELSLGQRLPSVQKQAETACPLGEQESTGGGRRRRQGGGRRVCILLWALGWEGWDPRVFTLPSTSQAELSCGSGTVKSKSTEHPINPQRGHRAGLLSLAGPELLVMPIKSLGAQHGTRLGQSCCLAPWPPFPTANETGPQERSQGHPWARGGVEEATQEAAGPPFRHRRWQGLLEAGHRFPLNTIFKSPSHHWLHQQATVVFALVKGNRTQLILQGLTQFRHLS